MTRRKSTKPAPAPPPAPPAPRFPDVPDPPWPARLGAGTWSRQQDFRFSDTTRRALTVPRWQREQLWTPDMQAAFCRSIWDGSVMGSHVLLWERPGRELLVVDGQQRLSALGLPVRRHDGTFNACSAFLDIDSGEWVTERAPWRFTAAEVSDLSFVRMAACATDPEEWRRSLWTAHACDRIRDLRITASVIAEDVPVSTVQAWFRTMAIPGVALTPEEAERLCAAAEETP